MIAASAQVTVVYVHGLWMTGFEGVLFRRRLCLLMDAEVPAFHYRSVSRDLSQNALALRRALSAVRTDCLHLVGHSLGGLVISKMFEMSGQDLAPGRVVFMGSPVAGSRPANKLARFRLGKYILGRTINEAFQPKRVMGWDVARDLGIIAGTVNFGLGRLVTSEHGDSDGTVFVDETRLRGMKEHIQMPVSHSMMPFSGVVARKVADFLRAGTFSDQASRSSSLS